MRRYKNAVEEILFDEWRTVMKKWIGTILAIMLLLTSCNSTNESKTEEPEQETKIFLYGEHHGDKRILEMEARIWKEHYDSGMRHLFVEMPYFSAEFLNLWMQEKDDKILEELYAELEGTQVHVPEFLEFYRQIKKECPETIFHGTDVGHQVTTGNRYFAYLEQNGQQSSERYRLAQENIEQGVTFYEEEDHAYREKKMTENFIRAFDALDGEKIMGIYGSLHVDPKGKDPKGSVSSMASRLKKHYGDIISCEDLALSLPDVEPLRVDTIQVNGKIYQASYFGSYKLSVYDYVSREFWRLEDAYDDFKEKPTTQDVLPYDNYPMKIEEGQVFVIDYTKKDGTIERMYYRSDGDKWQGRPTTVQIAVE